MAKDSDEKKFNDALKRALSMPPQPHKPLGKKKAARKKTTKPTQKQKTR